MNTFWSKISSNQLAPLSDVPSQSGITAITDKNSAKIEYFKLITFCAIFAKYFTFLMSKVFKKIPNF